MLGRAALDDDDLLTDDVEEEYDALNDETFNQAANGKKKIVYVLGSWCLTYYC